MNVCVIGGQRPTLAFHMAPSCVACHCPWLDMRMTSCPDTVVVVVGNTFPDGKTIFS